MASSKNDDGGDGGCCYEEVPDLSVYMFLHPEGKTVLRALNYHVERDWGVSVSDLRSVGVIEDGRWSLVPRGCYDEGEDLNRAVMDAVIRNGWKRVAEGVRWDQFRRFGVLERSSCKAEALECVRQVQEEGQWARLGDLVDMLFLRFSLARDALVILRSDVDIRRLRSLLLQHGDEGAGNDPAIARLLAPVDAGGSSVSAPVALSSHLFPSPVFNVLHAYPHLTSCASTSPDACADLLEFVSRLKTGVADVLQGWEADCVFQGFKADGKDFGVYREHEEEGGKGEAGRKETRTTEDDEEEEGEIEDEEDVDDTKKRKKKNKAGRKAKSKDELLRQKCMKHVEAVKEMVHYLLRLVRTRHFIIPQLARMLVRIAEDRAVVVCTAQTPGSRKPVYVPVHRCSLRWTFMCYLTERAQQLSGGMVPSFKDVYDVYVAAEAEAGRRADVVESRVQFPSSSFSAAGKAGGGWVRKTRGGWSGYGGYTDPMVLLFEGPCERAAPRDYLKGWKSQAENVVSLPQRRPRVARAKKAVEAAPS